MQRFQALSRLTFLYSVLLDGGLANEILLHGRSLKGFVHGTSIVPRVQVGQEDRRMFIVSGIIGTWPNVDDCVG